MRQLNKEKAAKILTKLLLPIVVLMVDLIVTGALLLFVGEEHNVIRPIIYGSSLMSIPICGIAFHKAFMEWTLGLIFGDLMEDVE